MKALYHIYGLRFSIPFKCPELLQTEGMPDVVVREGEVSGELPAPTFNTITSQASGNKFLLKIPRIAHYMISDGCEITIQRMSGVSDDEVRYFLLSACLSPLLMQRGILPLHASGIETSKGAVLFMGNSSVGKSTLVGAFLARGYKMLADELTAIAHSDNSCIALPGFPCLKLWGDMVRQLNYDVKTTPLIRPEHPDLRKFAIPVETQFATTSMPVHAIYNLTSRNEVNLNMELLNSSDIFLRINNNVHQRMYIVNSNIRTANFKLTINLANTSRAREISRPDTPILLDEIVTMIEADFIQ